MKINRTSLARWVIAIFAFWCLNYNSSIGRYNDQIRNCRTTNRYVTSQNALGWADAEHARHATSVRTHLPEDHAAVIRYHRIHASLDRIVRTPCGRRYHRPGLFG